MFVEGGITFYEPSDLAIVSYDEDLYFRVDNPSTDQGFLIKLSDLDAVYAGISHNDHGTELVNGTCTMKVEFKEADNSIKLGKTGLRLAIYDHPTSPQAHLNFGGWLYLLGKDTNAKVYFDNSKQYTSPPNLNRTFTADGFLLHPCLAANKENVAPISEPSKKLARLNGITFEQNGFPGTGITFEDLEASGLPDAVSRDENGEPDGINLLCLIPLLVEEIKALRSEIDVLKGGERV
jgi:hypothetical protein